MIEFYLRFCFATIENDGCAQRQQFINYWFGCVIVVLVIEECSIDVREDNRFSSHFSIAASRKRSLISGIAAWARNQSGIWVLAGCSRYFFPAAMIAWDKQSTLDSSW